MNQQPFTGSERLESESQRFSYSNFYDLGLHGEHVTADDLCFFGRASAKCHCGFCQEMVARERDSRSIV